MNCLYTSNINLDNWSNISKKLIEDYCNKNSICFNCLNHPNINYIRERIKYHPEKAGNYSSIYSIYNFLESDYERMIWCDIDILIFTKDNLFNIFPDLYLENGYPEGKIYEKDCDERKLEKLKFVQELLNIDYSMTVNGGLFSFNKEYAKKFINHVETIVDFNSLSSIDNYCNYLNKREFIPRDEVFFESFVIKNNITPKRILKTKYTKQLYNFNNPDCDIAHFCTEEGKELLKTILKENYANS